MEISPVTRPAEADVLALLSVAELKANLRITNSAEDDVMKASILAAYDWLANPENGWLNRSLITQSFRMTSAGFLRKETYSSTLTGGPAVRYVPTAILEVPLPPLRSVTSIKYLVDGVQTTLAGDQYVVTTTGSFGKIWRAYGVSWPTIDTHPESVEIVFSAGYGTGAEVKTLCPGIVQAMKLLAGDAFRNREDTYAEPRLVAVNRKIMNGVQFYAGRYRFLNNHA